MIHCPSAFYDYLNRTDKPFIKTVLKPALKSIIVDCSSIQPKVLFNEGFKIERFITSYFKEQKKEYETEICRYIDGCQLALFYTECVRICAESRSSVVNANVELKGIGEIDLVFKDMIIDIKSYRKFALGEIAKVMVQMMIYAEYYGRRNVSKLMVYIPTQNRYVYVEIASIPEDLYIEILDRFREANGIKKKKVECCQCAIL